MWSSLLAQTPATSQPCSSAPQLGNKDSTGPWSKHRHAHIYTDTLMDRRGPVTDPGGRISAVCGTGIRDIIAVGGWLAYKWRFNQMAGQQRKQSNPPRLAHHLRPNGRTHWERACFTWVPLVISDPLNAVTIHISFFPQHDTAWLRHTCVSTHPGGGRGDAIDQTAQGTAAAAA